MKETLFTLMLLVSIPVFFTGCAEDMYEDSTSLEDLYRQKAAEFSRKYGVEVRIRKEKLAEAVRTKTLEDLENDIRRLATLRIELIKEVPNLRQRMAIRKRKTRSEEPTEQKGSFHVTGSIHATGITGDCSGTVSWSCQLGQRTLDVNLNYSNVVIITDTDTLYSSGRCSFSFTNPIFTYYSDRNDISMNNWEDVYIDFDVYQVMLCCQIVKDFYYNEGTITISNRILFTQKEDEDA